jgi:hypothetical protein
VLKLADKPTGLVGGGNGIKSSLFGDLTAPWRFDPSLYSKLARFRKGTAGKAEEVGIKT